MTLSIAAGSYHSCAIKSDHTITCWGYDDSGQADAPEGPYAAISGGLGHSCGIKIDQTITCWGNNNEGQASAPPGQFTAIDVGSFHSCAIRTDQAVTCWGYSDLTDAPIGQYIAISAGGGHTCAIKIDQTITCWGYGGLTDAPAGRYIAISAGGGHACGIRTDGSAQCWGDSFSGQADAPAGQYTAITAGHAHSCGIKIDQTITCWGDNDHGRADAPTGQYTDISAGGGHSCGIKIDQTITCWGDNSLGQADAFADQYTEISTSSATGSEFLDTWDREAVVAGFTAEFDRQEPDHGWTGDLARCMAGTTSQEYRDSIFQRMNWYRQMAGVLPLVEDPELSGSAQTKAMMLAAEDRLSHRPTPDWACYTSIPRYTESIASTSGITSIDLYMRDSGSNNESVGHRRMITDGKLELFGTGDIPGRANTLHAQYSSAQREIREQRGFVAWPSPGYIPYTAVWGRWSFTALPWADFSDTTVVVIDDNGVVETEIIHNRDSALVWAMDGDTNSRTHARPREGDRCYAVTISGVKIEGEAQPPYEYATCVTEDPRHSSN